VFRDYLKLTKPRIVSLLTFSGVGAYFAAGGTSFVSLLVLTISLVCVASSASVLNCYYDRELDKLMERTRDRPLPSGRVSPAEALAFANGLLAVGLLMAGLFLTRGSLRWLLYGFIAYVGLYTILLKRRHWLGVVLGGSAGSFPVLAGWSAEQPASLSAWLMALFVFAWTPAHAWVLEFVFRDEYERAGIPTYPVVKSRSETGRGVLVAACLTVLSAVPLIAHTGPFYTGLFLVSSPLFLFGYYPFYRRPDRRNAVLAFFTANMYLSLLFLGWAIDGFLGHPGGWGFWISAVLTPFAFVGMWRARPSLGSYSARVPWQESAAPTTTPTE
jgi:protoheme IX farnesyltransferase